MLATKHPTRHLNPCNKHTGPKQGANLEARTLPRERVRSMARSGPSPTARQASHNRQIRDIQRRSRLNVGLQALFGL